MVIRYSTCHFAETIEELKDSLLMGERCSFCGEACHLVPMEHRLEYDLELTLRRWKDGDCSLDEMFERVNKELFRSWNDVFKVAQEQLQQGGQPKYIYQPDQMRWYKADDPVSDLVVKSDNANTNVANPPSDPKRKANT